MTFFKILDQKLSIRNAAHFPSFWDNFSAFVRFLLAERFLAFSGDKKHESKHTVWR